MKICLCMAGSIMLGATLVTSLPGQTGTDDPSEELTSILIRHGDPGGVSVVTDCSPHNWELKGSPRQTTDEELDALSKNGDLDWHKVGGGYFVRLADGGDESLLAVRLPEIALNKADPVVGMGVLLANQVVEEEQTRLELKMQDRSIGFSSLPTKTSLVLPPGTLVEDLNRIAVHSGKAVWLYKESDCSGERIGSFSWIAR